MKNIHVLPTEKPSVLKQNNITKKISLVNKGIDLTAYTPINIYITSDEEIKEGDWYIDTSVFKENIATIYIYQMKYFKWGIEGQGDCKKIILTTDQDLIKDGVQAIDDEFLEWFVKNPSCEWVDVERDEREVGGHNGGVQIQYGLYEINIPKEEANEGFIACNETLEGINTIYHQTSYGNLIKELTKHEALEEAAYKLFSTMPSEISTSTAKSKALELAKWQAARLYDVEEVYSIVRMCLGMKESGKTDIEIGACLERYRKK